MVDYLRKFVQETGLQTTMVKQIETMVFSEAIANKRQRTLDSWIRMFCSALIMWCILLFESLLC